MVAVAVLTALAAQLAYDARVSLQIAANTRNELQATYLAKSGVAASRLVLAFQQQLDESLKTMTAGVPGAGTAVPRPQLWRMAPVSSELTDAIFGGTTRSHPEAGVAPGAAAGPAAGTFLVDLSDEQRKVNANLEGQETGLLPAQVQAFWQLVCDPRWDALFDREDANGQRYARADLLVNLRDWVDEDTTSSALDAAFAGCAVATAAKPFVPAFGDENFPYDRGEDRYKAKNARMDSLDELYLVAGISDAFMAAFGDSLTVYLPVDTRQNINETDPARLLTLLRTVASPPDQPAVNDPQTLVTLQRAILARTAGGMLALSVADFRQIVEGLGVKVDQALLTEGGPKSPFTSTSMVFRLRAAGRAGDVTKRLDVVMRAEAIKPNVPMPGKILHWREE
jgi:general secretion pathway protein K